MRIKRRALRDPEKRWATEIRSCADCFDCGQPRGPDTLSGLCYHTEGRHKFIENIWVLPDWCPLRPRK